MCGWDVTGCQSMSGSELLGCDRLAVSGSEWLGCDRLSVNDGNKYFW